MDPRDPAFRAKLDAHLARYAGAEDRRAVAEVAATVVIYALALAGTALGLRLVQDAATGPALFGALALTALCAFVLAGTQVRAFLVHHDLTHGSLFTTRRWNDRLAPFVGALVATAPSVWQREHARHHRDSNNLDRSQDGQTAAWTVADFEAAPGWQRALYRLVHQRPILFGVLPPLYFFGFMRVRARWYENTAFFGFLALLWATGSLGAFALAMFPAMAFGFLVFHAQHTFENLVRHRTAEYDFVENGLLGSTLLVVPRWPVAGGFIDWALYGVAYHHVHHLRPGLPAWRLKRIHEEGGALFDATPRITLPEAWSSARLTLYDEAHGRLVSFAGGG